MKNNPVILIAMLAIATLSVGCAGPEREPRYYDRPASSQRYGDRVGVVDRIEVIRKDSGSNAAGTVIGAIVGGVIGHQIGGGRGKDVATVAGAVGGAVAGNEMQKRSRSADETFRVTVLTDDGYRHTVIQDDITDLRTGDRVRIEGDRVYRY
jgi:outer membrane lipoprotein SlyB